MLYVGPFKVPVCD